MRPLLAKLLGCTLLAGCPRHIADSRERPAVPVRFLGCHTDPPITTESAALLPDYPDRGALFAPAAVRGGELVAYLGGSSYNVARAEGVLAVDGYRPVALAWEQSVARVSRCSPSVLKLVPADTFVAGQIHDPVGRKGEYVVVGCGGFDLAGVDRRFDIATLQAQEYCDLWARRVDSSRWGSLTRVEPNDGGRIEVELTATPPPIPAIGIDVSETRRGLLVARSRNPGLPKGATIMAVDGVSLRSHGSTMRLADMLSRDGDHTLDVALDGSTRQVVVGVSRSRPWW